MSNRSKYNYELIRYSSELNTNVIGGASKLLSHFIKEHEGTIVSYADRRWSNGNLYKTLGFEFDGFIKPGYVYYNIKNKTIHNRMMFQKHLLKNLPIYDEKLTESDLMKINGYEKIWNAGNTRCIFNI